MTAAPVVHKARLRRAGPDGRLTEAVEVELHEVTHLFGDVNAEDTVYRSPKGCTIKLKTVEVPGVAGNKHYAVSAALVDPETAKALDHPSGKGGKFVLDAAYRVDVMAYAPADLDEGLRNGHAQAVHMAENAWGHHGGPAQVRAGAFDPSRHPLIALAPIHRR